MKGERNEDSMRIVINATASLGVKTGVGHYTAELIRTLQKHPT